MRNLPKNPILCLTVVAMAEVARATAVNFDGSQTAAGQAMFGVADTQAYQGDELCVDVLGTSSLLAGAAISEGDLVQVGSNGKFVTATTGKVVARALTDASGDGSDFNALLLPSNT